MEIFTYGFMIQALIAALVVGVSAPTVGIYLVQKRMALIGDGLGHVALTGVALGFLTSTSPLWTTLLVTALGAVAVEVIRTRGKASGDVALALLFYGGIAGGVFITSLVSGKTNASLNEYLFGALLTASPDEVWAIGILGGVVMLLMLVLRPWLAAICHDEEHARVAGLPVGALNLLVAVTTAVTVSVAMRAVGLLLISALLVVPVVTAQQFTKGFATTMYAAMGLGLAASGLGFVTAGLLETVPPGAAIVLVAVAMFIVVAVARAVWLGIRRRSLAPAPAAVPLSERVPSATTS